MYTGHCIGRLNDVLEPVFGWSKPYEFQYGDGKIMYHRELIGNYKFNYGTDVPEIKFVGNESEYYQKLYNDAVESGRVKNLLKLVQKERFVLHYKFPDGEWREMDVSWGGFRSFESAANWMDVELPIIKFVEKIVVEVYE